MNQDMQTESNMEFDVDDILATSPDHLRKRVGVAFDDDGNPKSGFVIVSKDATEYRERANELRAAGIQRQANKRTRIDTKTQDGAEEFARILESNDFELAAAVVVDWFGFTRAGEPLPFNKNVARQMLEKRPSWAQKISAELENEEGFLKLSATNSAISRAANLAIVSEAKTA